MSFDYTKIESYVDKKIVRYNEEMKKHTTVRIGGPADVLVLPTNMDEVKQTLKFVKENNLPINIIGNGSKLLVRDEGIRGIVIKIGSNMSGYKIDGEYIVCDAGIMLPKVCVMARDASLSGLEFASGIPGCVGGSVVMNAGAYGSEMSAVVEEVTYIDKNLEIKTIEKEELEFAYRKSYFKLHEDENNVVLSVKLKLVTGDKNTIIYKMKENNDSRREKQPLEHPSAGSTFKRPEGYYVGKLIDDIGFRGKVIGGAQISTKHVGFIVNIDNATAKDVLDLIERTQQEVKKKFGVDLEPEIQVIGG